MIGRILGKKLTTFRIMILGFMGAILIGTILLMLPVSSQSGEWTSFENSLFTATSAICVTGLVVRDTASYWSGFGQAILLLMIQIGGLGVVAVAAFITSFSGKKISLFQRSILQDSLAAPQIGGIVKMTIFIFKITFIVELAGALVMLPGFISDFGAAGIWMAFFHSISAFCNAGFDIMGTHTGEFSSLTFFSNHPEIVIPVCLLIIIGGIGFLTWEDVLTHKFHFKKYRMQSKAIIITSLVLVAAPAIVMFFSDFASYPIKDRIFLSLFQAITPRTAGFNTADLTSITSAGRAMIIILMLIGGSPGSTAGGMKTTTVAVLFANGLAVFRQKKSVAMFGRRIEDSVVKNAATLLVMYLTFSLVSAIAISIIEGLSFDLCIFETISAIGTVGLSLGITPSLGLVSHLILIGLMFFGRVGGLTLLLAAVSDRRPDVSQYPIEKINVG